MRAAIAASLLDASGRDVVAVDDGFDAATEAGLTVTTADREPAGPCGPAPDGLAAAQLIREADFTDT